MLGDVDADIPRLHGVKEVVLVNGLLEQEPLHGLDGREGLAVGRDLDLEIGRGVLSPIVDAGLEHEGIDLAQLLEIQGQVDGGIAADVGVGIHRPTGVIALIQTHILAVGQVGEAEVGAVLVAVGAAHLAARREVLALDGGRAECPQCPPQGKQGGIHLGLLGLGVTQQSLGLGQRGGQCLPAVLTVLLRLDRLGLGDRLLQIVEVGHFLHLKGKILVTDQQDTLTRRQPDGIHAIDRGQRLGLARHVADTVQGADALIHGKGHRGGCIVVAVDHHGVVAAALLVLHVADRQLLIPIGGMDEEPGGQLGVARAEALPGAVEGAAVQFHQGRSQSLHGGIDLGDRLKQVGRVAVDVDDGGAVGLGGVGTGGLPAEVGDLLDTRRQRGVDLIANGIGVRAVAPVPRHGLDVGRSVDTQPLTDLTVVLQLAVQGVLGAGGRTEGVGIVHDVIQRHAVLAPQLLLQSRDDAVIGTAEVHVGDGVRHHRLDQGNGAGEGNGIGWLIHHIVATHARQVGVAVDKIQYLFVGLVRPAACVEIRLADRHVQPALVSQSQRLEVVLIGDGIRIQREVQLHVGDAARLEVIEHRLVDVLLIEEGDEGHDLELLGGGVVRHCHGHLVGLPRLGIGQGNGSLAIGNGLHRAVILHLHDGGVRGDAGHGMGGLSLAVGQEQAVALTGTHEQGILIHRKLSFLGRRALYAVQLQLAQGRVVSTGGIELCVAGDVDAKIVHLGRIDVVGQGNHRRVGGGMGIDVFGGDQCRPGLAVEGALQFKGLGGSIPLVPLHGLDHDPADPIGRIQREGNIHRVVFPGAIADAAVPAQLDIAAGVGVPVAVHQVGIIEEALGRNVGAGGGYTLPQRDVGQGRVPAVRNRRQNRQEQAAYQQEGQEGTRDAMFHVMGSFLVVSSGADGSPLCIV